MVYKLLQIFRAQVYPFFFVYRRFLGGSLDLLIKNKLMCFHKILRAQSRTNIMLFRLFDNFLCILDLLVSAVWTMFCQNVTCHQHRTLCVKRGKFKTKCNEQD